MRGQLLFFSATSLIVKTVVFIFGLDTNQSSPTSFLNVESRTFKVDILGTPKFEEVAL